MFRWLRQLFCFYPHFTIGEEKPFMKKVFMFCVGEKYLDDITLYECEKCGKRGIIGAIRSRLPRHYTEFDEIDSVCDDWINYKITLNELINYCKKKGWVK